MLTMTCPHCRRRIELDDSRRGRPARCPQCSGIFRAPLEDDQPATGAAGRGGAQGLLIGAACLSMAGLLATLGAILIRANGGHLPLDRTLLEISIALPIAVVGLTWLLARKADGPLWIFLPRFAAYLWILCLMILRLKMM